VICRHFFNTVGQIVDAHERIREPFDFHWWIIYNYIVTTSVSIRRLMDPRLDTISLYRLLKEIEANPGEITRRSFVSRYPAFIRQSAHRTFDKLAGSRSMSFPPLCARLDRQRLYREHRRIRTWVNKNFAHLDQKNMRLDQKNMRRKPPTLDELHSAVALFEEVFLKYRLLLTGIDSNTLLPIWQHDWTTVSREPWLT
jgi:hypothetical protein